MIHSYDMLLQEFDLQHKVHYISIVLEYFKIKRNKTEEFYT